MSSQAKVTKAKTEKWDYIKLKSFLHREGNYQQSVFANDVSKELMPKIYKKTRTTQHLKKTPGQRT